MDYQAHGQQGSRPLDCKPVKALPLVDGGWTFTEPNPYNPGGNLRDGDLPTVVLDLSDKKLPGYRLAPEHGIVLAPALTALMTCPQIINQT